MKQKPTSSSRDLEAYLNEIGRLTGLRVCLYDFSYFTQDLPVLHVGPEMRVHLSPLCLLVKSDPRAHAECVQNEYRRAAQASETGEPFVHVCHAGLTDIVLPIRCGQRTIGAIYLGQSLVGDRRKLEAALERVAERFGHDLEQLRATIATVPRTTRAQLHRHVTLLTLLREYIELSVALHGPSHQDASLHPLTQEFPIVSMEQVPTYDLDELRPQSEAIKKAIAIIKGNYWKKIDLPQVAREVGLSPGHFSRQFQRETGFTFRECLVRSRIAAAAYLLKKTELGSKRISQMLGYSAPSNFVRAFKKSTDVTIREFPKRQTYPLDPDFGGDAPAAGGPPPEETRLPAHDSRDTPQNWRDVTKG